MSMNQRKVYAQRQLKMINDELAKEEKRRDGMLLYNIFFVFVFINYPYNQNQHNKNHD